MPDLDSKESNPLYKYRHCVFPKMTIGTENSSQIVQQDRKPTPLPKLQLFITYLIQFSEPITALVIYPFVNQFVRDTGITNGDETKTGYYAGVIVSGQESVHWIILKLNS